MDNRPPFTVTGRILKSKSDGKSSEAPKIKVKEPLVTNRERRMFGTVRNQNVLVNKPGTEKPARKPGISQKLSKHPIKSPAKQEADDGIPKKPAENNNLATTKKKKVSFREKKVEENKERPVQEGDVISGEKGETPSKSPILIKPGKKKSVNFSEKAEECKEKVSKEEHVVSGAGLQTPLRSSFLVRSNNVSGTPYQSAERCSKCRFDKLETSSYWLGQIRLAESVGKHFVSAVFFRLASECNAEPIRNVKVELKKYIGRHEHLSGEKEWKELCVSFGLIKQESGCTSQENQEAGKTEETAEVAVNDQHEEKQIAVDTGVVEPCECE